MSPALQIKHDGRKKAKDKDCTDRADCIERLETAKASKREIKQPQEGASQVQSDMHPD